METGPVNLSECSGVYKSIPRRHFIVRNDPNTKRLLIEDPEGWKMVVSHEAYAAWLNGGAPPGDMRKSFYK